MCIDCTLQSLLNYGMTACPLCRTPITSAVNATSGNFVVDEHGAVRIKREVHRQEDRAVAWYEQLPLVEIPICVRDGGRALVGRRVALALEDGAWPGTVSVYSSRRGHYVRLDDVQGEDTYCEWHDLSEYNYGRTFTLLP